MIFYCLSLGLLMNVLGLFDLKGSCKFYPFYLVVDVNTLKNKRFHACALETLRLSATNPERSQVLVSGLLLNALVILFASCNIL